MQKNLKMQKSFAINFAEKIHKKAQKNAKKLHHFLGRLNWFSEFQNHYKNFCFRYFLERFNQKSCVLLHHQVKFLLAPKAPPG